MIYIYTNKRYDSIGRARQHCDGAVGVRAWQCVCIMRGQRLAAAHQVRTARTKRAEQSRDWCAPNDDDDDDVGSMMVVVVAAAAGHRYLCLTTTWPPTHHYHAPTTTATTTLGTLASALRSLLSQYAQAD